MSPGISKKVRALRTGFYLAEKILKRGARKRLLSKLFKLKKKLNRVWEENKELKAEDVLDFAKNLKKIMEEVLFPKIYILEGVHGGILFEDSGYFEFDSEEHAKQALLKLFQLAETTGIPLNLEVSLSSLEVISKRDPEFIEKLKEIIQKGKVDFINPMYSQPYGLIIGSESNLRHFIIGGEVYKKLLGGEPLLFISSEFSLHPQIPQILSKLGIKFTSLRFRFQGLSPSFPSPKIIWRGPDGSEVISLAPQSGLFIGECVDGSFFEELPQFLFQSNFFPHPYVVYTNLEDFVIPGRFREEVYTLSKYAPVFGEITSYTHFFKSTPPPEGVYRLSRDSFRIGRFKEKSLFQLHLKGEFCLLEGELWNAVARSLGGESFEDKLKISWKRFLQSQDHDSYVIPYYHPGDFSRDVGERVPEVRKIAHSLPKSKKTLTIGEKAELLAESSIKDASRIIHHSLLKVADSIKLPGGGYKIAVFNPTSWRRKEVVKVNLPFPKNGELEDSWGRGIRVQVIGEREFVFLAEIPPLGYNTYRLKKRKTPSGKNQSLKEEKSIPIELGREKKKLWIEKGKSKIIALGLLEGRNLSPLYLKGLEWGPFISLAQWEGDGFSLGAKIFKPVNRIEFTLSLQKEKINLCLFTEKKETPRYFINYPFGIEQTGRRTIQSLEFLGIDLGGKLLLTYAHGGMQYFTLEKEKGRIINELLGKGEYRFSLTISSPSKIKEAEFLKQARSFYQPVEAVVSRVSGDLLPPQESFLSIDQEFIVLSAFYREGKNLIMRLFNSGSEEIPQAGVFLKIPFQKAYFTDFWGKRQKEVKIQDPGKFELNFLPWEIKEIVLTL